jgi:hypothetical protein
MDDDHGRIIGGMASPQALCQTWRVFDAVSRALLRWRERGSRSPICVTSYQTELMHSRHITLIGALLVAMAAVVALVGVVQYQRGSTGDPPSTEALMTPSEPPGGESVTLRFFKAPAAVSGFNIRTLGGKTITSADLVARSR